MPFLNYFDMIYPQSVVTLSQFGGLHALQIPEAMPAVDLTPGRFTHTDHGGQVILNLYALDFKYQPLTFTLSKEDQPWASCQICKNCGLRYWYFQAKL